MNTKKFLLLITVSFMCSVNYMILVPFIPIEFGKFKLKPSTYGYIYSCFPLTSMLLSFFVARFMDYFGRKQVLIGGISCMTLSMISFSLSHYITNASIIALVLCVIRVLQGISGCLVTTSVFAIVCAVYSENKTKFIGFAQSAKGAGCSIGPFIGTLLYTLFGFQGTYFIMTGIFGSLLILCSVFIDDSVNITDTTAGDQAVLRAHDAEKEGQSQKGETPIDGVSYCVLFTRRVYLLTAIASIMSNVNFCYYEPVMTDRLQGFGLNNFWIGFMFSLAPFSYFLTLLLFSMFLKKSFKVVHVFIGVIISAFSLILIGPGMFLPDNLVLMSIGLLWMGASSVLFILPILPILTEDGVSRYPQHKYKVSDISSVVLSFCLSLGQTIGPIYGSYATEYLGFRNCSSCLGVFVFCFALTYYFGCVFPVKNRYFE
ncbi:unnamed protein product [Moneuplotes crassus]|uniref:Major facilitator superfamily (MFS) profile domain-containing protein n=1 Tax=Euplotes crassus TaxID=5936 RepID=A0AAD1UM27_EUPCR|nr:unnamed protein product [Moneuplotes crassus]